MKTSWRYQLKFLLFLLAFTSGTILAQGSCPATGSGSCGGAPASLVTGRLPTRILSTVVEPEDSGMMIYLVQEDQDSMQFSVHFTLEESDSITLGLSDKEGEPVALLADGYFEAGNHRIDRSTEDLEPGMYLITLEAPQGRVTVVIYLLG
jgi:hypothetical protein